MSDAAGTPLSRPKRRSRRTYRRILAYSFPYWRTIAIVLLLTGVYTSANGLRLGIVGLVIDGVLTPQDGTAEKGKATKVFEKYVLPHLPEQVVLTRAFTISENVSQLEIVSGTPPIEGERSSDGWRYEFADGLAHLTSTGGSTVRDAPFQTLAVIVPAPLEGFEPPFSITSAVIRLTRTEGSGEGMFPLLATIALAGMFLALLIAATSFGRVYLALKVQVNTIAALRADIFRHLSGLSLDFFHGRRSGDLISRLTNDVGAVQQSLRYIFGDLIQHPFTILTMIAIAFTASPPLTLMVLPVFPLLLFPIIRSGRKVKRHGRGSLEKLGEVTESMGQLLSGIRVVKAYGLEPVQLREFDERNAGFVRSSLKMTIAKVTSRSALEGLYNIMAAGAILLGGWLLTRGTLKIPLSDFAMFLGAITGLYQPLRSITRIYNTVSESAAGAERVFDLLDEKSTITDRPGAPPFPALAESIVFDGVWFRYGPEEPWVLREIDLTVRRGETVALVGPSGAGKSTLLDLLARFHDPVDGRILVDGMDLRDGAHASLLAQFAIVGQDPFLFHSTIAENIRGGRGDATDEEVRAAAAAAAIEDEIDAMPAGYQTVIGERGLKLSGGQRQRLTIARAILKNANILILDEATSSLDTGSEREVQRALDNLLTGRTTFVIAHRLSTIQHANRILVLDAGRIIETGTHDDLVARRGAYARLLEMQELHELPQTSAQPTKGPVPAGGGAGAGGEERSEG